MNQKKKHNETPEMELLRWRCQKYLSSFKTTIADADLNLNFTKEKCIW